MPKEKIVILGHTGFVGSHLYCKLQRESTFEIYGFSSKEINLLDINAYQKLADICDEKTIVIMAAGLVRSKTDNILTLEKNIKMVINLAKFLSSVKIKHLIYTSTISVYGKTSKMPISEASSVNPDSFYSSAKACGELILKGICEELNITLTTLRIGRIYGKSDITSPIFIFSQNIISEKSIEIYGDGSHRLYCVHQNDFFSIIKKVILERIEGDYNITSSIGITTLELIESLFKIGGGKTEIKFKSIVDSPVLLTFDTSKLQSTFKDFPSVSLTEGLKEYFKNKY